LGFERPRRLEMAKVVDGKLICDQGHKMVLRNGKYGKFYGCSAFPKCKETVNMGKARKMAEEARNGGSQAAPKEFKPSHRQAAIKDFILERAENLVVVADAGSGKTSTCVWTMGFLPKDKDIVFCCFNASIQRELAGKVPSHVQARTFHSLGFQAVKAHLGYTPEVDGNKVWNIVKEYLPDNKDKEARIALKKMVSMAKNTLTDGHDEAALSQMATYYRIDLNGEEEKVLPLVGAVMETCKHRMHIIDFDDMIWLPLTHDMSVQQYDIVYVDEDQDMNVCQIELIKRMINPDGGRLIAVGDPKQSIYGFRGADCNAVGNIIEAFQAETLPLDITYRNSKAVLNLVRETFPDVTTEAAPWAEEGEVRDMAYSKFMYYAKDGDLVLCRVNAPLVKACYAFIRAGRKAVIRGRDIGKSMQAFIDKLMKAVPSSEQSITRLLSELNDYKYREAQRLADQDKEERIESLYDRCDTLVALADGAKDLADLRHKIDVIFDDVQKVGIILSSVHRAKGTEADRVFILKPDLMPHPMAKAEWQMVQEENVKYVAYTRAKKELVFVSGA
jgi:DNA helicase-2/ATP-dependent DNA helicase PcrA